MSMGSFVEMSAFLREERELMETREAKMEAKLERQAQSAKEAEAKIEAKMEAKLEQQRREMERLAAPQEAISAQQIEALTTRLEALHAAKLLSDDELFAVEDCVADFVEARASCEVVTMEIVNANRAIGKVHKLVALGEAMGGDAMFARQLRRKFT